MSFHQDFCIVAPLEDPNGKCATAPPYSCYTEVRLVSFLVPTFLCIGKRIKGDLFFLWQGAIWCNAEERFCAESQEWCYAVSSCDRGWQDLCPKSKRMKCSESSWVCRSKLGPPHPAWVLNPQINHISMSIWLNILACGNSMQAVILINEPELKITYEGQIAKEALSQGHLTCKRCESHRVNSESSCIEMMMQYVDLVT